MTVLPISMGLAITTDHCGEKYLRFPGIWELSGLSMLSCKASRFKRRRGGSFHQCTQKDSPVPSDPLSRPSSLSLISLSIPKIELVQNGDGL